MTMDPPAEASLDQILATIPPQNQPMLNQKISDIHLANISRSLTNWSSVCVNLGINEAEEEAIVADNRTADARRRAVLRKWRQKYSPIATYRNLAKCFYDAGKPEMVEVICKALGAPSDSVVGQSVGLQGSQTAAPPPGMQQVIGQFGNPVGSYPAPYQPQGGVGFGNQLIFAQAQPPQQGDVILTEGDLHILSEILKPAAPQWQTLGGALGILEYDLDIIQHKPMLIVEGSLGYLREALSLWLKWAPPNHHWPTVEALTLAVQSTGQEGLAFNLKTLFLQKKGMQPQPAGPVYNLPQSQPMHTQQQMPQQLHAQTHMPGQHQQLSGYTDYPPSAHGVSHQNMPPVNYGVPQQSMPPANYGVPQQSMPPANYGGSQQSMPPANYGVPQQSMPPANYGVPQQSMPPANYGVSQQSMPPANYGISQQSMPPANYGVSQQSMPPANYGVSQQSMPPANYGVSQQSMPPANYGVSQQSMPPANYGISQQSMPPANYGVSLQNIPPANYGVSQQDMPPANYGVSQQNTPQFHSQTPTVTYPQPVQPAGSGYRQQQPTVSDFFPSQDKQTVVPDGGPDKKPYDRYEAYPRGNVAEMKLSFGTVIPDTNIKQSADRGEERYEMRATPHGVAVIINNEEFDKLSAREGTDIDEKNLIQTFRYLGYTVEVHREKTSEQILGIFEDIQKRDHSNHDSFVCCILSHGKGTGIYGCDDVLVEIEAISSKLNGTACQTLAGKPKMCFFQACRGKARDPVVTDSDESEGDSFFNPIVTDSGESVPIEGDFFFGYATPLNYVAFCDMDNGSWYVLELCRILCTYGASAPLTDIHKKVKGEVNKRYQFGSKKQISEDRSRLRKAVYFM